MQELGDDVVMVGVGLDGPQSRHWILLSLIRTLSIRSPLYFGAANLLNVIITDQKLFKNLIIIELIILKQNCPLGIFR